MLCRLILASVKPPAALESLYVLAHFLSPYIPEGSAQIFQRFSTPAIPIFKLSPSFCNLKPGKPLLRRAL